MASGGVKVPVDRGGLANIAKHALGCGSTLDTQSESFGWPFAWAEGSRWGHG